MTRDSDTYSKRIFETYWKRNEYDGILNMSKENAVVQKTERKQKQLVPYKFGERGC